jgi:hypothetical protein
VVSSRVQQGTFFRFFFFFFFFGEENLTQNQVPGTEGGSG